MSDKSIIIIGAGIAGLSAGCYGQMNDYRTSIFETHNMPGGLCTSWRRQGYTIDLCLHWLVGSASGSNFYRLWEELGAVQGRRMIDHEEFMHFEGANKKVAGYPVGGSLEFSRAIEQRYLHLGGEVRYNARVSKILVKDDCAVGVRLEDGSEHQADYVVSAADGHTTIFDMLDGKYTDEKIKGYYDDLSIFPPLIHVALGVNRLFEEMPHPAMGLDFPLDQPVTIAGKEWNRLRVHIYNFDPTLAPAGKTVVKVMFTSDYAYWESLREDLDRYKAEKERIANQVVALLDKRFQGLATQVEMYDVATPVTFHRYTGNWQGTFEGWMVTPKTWNLRMSKTLPGLDRFYMAGQWVEPGGGLPPSALSGRNVIQILCKRDKKRFVSTLP